MSPTGQPASTISIADRMRGAIWGQFVGDAACLGSHWIYDPAEIDRTWPGGIRGFEAPSPGHYHARRRPGQFTHYGDVALLLLESVVERGRFEPVDFGRRFVETVGSAEYPGYLDKAMKGTLARHAAFRTAYDGDAFDFQQGADDFEPATVSRLAPIVVLYSADEDILGVVESVTRVTQDNALAVAYASYHALVLRELLLGARLDEVFNSALPALQPGEINDGIRRGVVLAQEMSAARDVRAATSALGQHCRLDQSLPSAVCSALANKNELGAAILATAHAGGDSAGRSAMIGAWLGAALGIDSVPLAWRERLEAHDRIDNLVERLIARATG